jgi:hypothetical protein
MTRPNLPPHLTAMGPRHLGTRRMTTERSLAFVERIAAHFFRDERLGLDVHIERDTSGLTIRVRTKHRPLPAPGD